MSDPILFADIVGGALLGRTAHTLVMPLHGLVTYWDGSGTENDKQQWSSFVLAGFIGSHDQWAQTEKAWKAKLWDKYRLRSYRSHNAEQLPRVCARRWSEGRLLELRLDLMHLLQAHRFWERGYAVAIKREDFDAVNARYDLDQYGVGGRYVLAGLRLLALVYERRGIAFSDIAAQANIMLFLERGDAGQDRLVEVLDREYYQGKMGTPVDTLPKSRYNFLTKRLESYAPFEAADFLAYEVRAARHQVSKNEPASAYRKSGLNLEKWLHPEPRDADVADLTRLCEHVGIERKERRP